MEECFRNYIGKYSKNNVNTRNCNDTNTNPDTDITFTNCNRCIIEKIGYAQAYVPYQEDTNTVSEGQSLLTGTVFSALEMPYEKGSALRRFSVKE